MGSIGTNSNGNFQLYGTVASHVGLQFGSPSILPINNSGASSDNAVDLGDSNVRFKDLYLSGNLVVGTAGKGIDFAAQTPASGITPSAEILDHYEEGICTLHVTADGGTDFSHGTVDGASAYTRIGNLVTVTANASIASPTDGTGNILVTGLPFTANASYGNATSALKLGRFDVVSGVSYFSSVVANTTTFTLSYNVDAANPLPIPASAINGNSTPYFGATFSYITDL